MRTLVLVLILVLVAAFAIRDIVERSFEADIRLVIEESKPPLAATSSESGPGPTFSPETGFKGPTGDPKVTGPKFPPPNY